MYTWQEQCSAKSYRKILHQNGFPLMQGLGHVLGGTLLAKGRGVGAVILLGKDLQARRPTFLKIKVISKLLKILVFFKLGF